MLNCLQQNLSANYSLRPTKTVHLAFKIYPTKTVHLDCNEVHLIKAMTSTKKLLPPLSFDSPIFKIKLLSFDSPIWVDI